MMKKIILALIALSCNSCINNYYYNENRGLRPKKPKFRLAKPLPYHLQPDDLIDTTCVYVYTSSQKTKMALRFFANGRFINSFGNADYNNLEANKIGYYRVENKNIVLMETFIRSSPAAGGDGIYYRSVGIIKNDTLYDVLGAQNLSDVHRVGDKISTFYHIYYTYTKQKVDTLKGTPNW